MPKQLTLREIWGSHGGPVVRTWPFQCGSLGSIPGGGILKYQKLCGTAKKKKTQREISFQNLDESIFFFFFEFSQSIYLHYFHFQLLFLNIYLIYSWLRWVFATARSPAAHRCCYRGSEWRLLKVWSSRLSLPWPFSLWSRAPGCSGFIN